MRNNESKCDFKESLTMKVKNKVIIGHIIGFDWSVLYTSEIKCPELVSLNVSC